MAADASASSSSRLDAIVLLGSFNPLILDPYWLLQNELITQADLESVQGSGKWLATSEVVALHFRTFTLQAAKDRVQVRLTEEAETPLLIADLIVNIFSLLPHTPVSAVGLNHVSHRSLNDAHASKILDFLAPRASVAGLLPEIKVSSLSWAAERPDDYAGTVRLTVEPSLRVAGLYFDLNDHFDLGDHGSGQTVAELVGNEWQESLRRADDVFAKVLELE